MVVRVGMFDYYDGVQLKIGRRRMTEYRRGDSVLIPDGAYLGYEGIVIVHEGRLVRAYDTVTDKWGRRHPSDDVLLSLSNIQGHRRRRPPRTSRAGSLEKDGEHDGPR